MGTKRIDADELTEEPRSSPDLDEGDEAAQKVTRSELAQEISELQASITKAISKRERLPQPMFWSLFNSRIKDIRKRRELMRVLSEFLGG